MDKSFYQESLLKTSAVGAQLEDMSTLEGNECIDLTEDPNCFVCDAKITDNKKGFKVLGRFKLSKMTIAQKIADLIGPRFSVHASEFEYICFTCMSLFSKLDNFQVQVKGIEKSLRDILERTHELNKKLEESEMESMDEINDETNVPQIKNIVKNKVVQIQLSNSPNILKGFQHLTKSSPETKNLELLSKLKKVPFPNIEKKLINEQQQLMSPATVKNNVLNASYTTVKPINLPMAQSSAKAQTPKRSALPIVKAVEKVSNFRVARKRKPDDNMQQFIITQAGKNTRSPGVNNAGLSIGEPAAKQMRYQTIGTKQPAFIIDEKGKKVCQINDTSSLNLAAYQVINMPSCSPQKVNYTRQTKTASVSPRANLKSNGQSITSPKRVQYNYLLDMSPTNTAKITGQMIKGQNKEFTPKNVVRNKNLESKTKTVENNLNQHRTLITNEDGTITCYIVQDDKAVPVGSMVAQKPFESQISEKSIATTIDNNSPIQVHIVNTPQIVTCEKGPVVESKIEVIENVEIPTTLSSSGLEVKRTINAEGKIVSSDLLEEEIVTDMKTEDQPKTDNHDPADMLQKSDSTCSSTTVAMSDHSFTSETGVNQPSEEVPLSQEKTEENINIQQRQIDSFENTEAASESAQGMNITSAENNVETYTSTERPILTMDGLVHENKPSTTMDTEKIIPQEIIVPVQTTEQNVSNVVPWSCETISNADSLVNTSNTITLSNNNQQTEKMFLKLSDLVGEQQFNNDGSLIPSSNSVMNYTIPTFGTNVNTVTNVNTDLSKEAFKEENLNLSKENSNPINNLPQESNLPIVYNPDSTQNCVSICEPVSAADGTDNFVTYVYEEVNVVDPNAENKTNTVDMNSEEVKSFDIPVIKKDGNAGTDQALLQDLNNVYQDPNNFQSADQPLVILEQIPGGYGGETTDGGYSYQSVEVGNELMFDANGQQMILIIPGEGYADQEQPAE